MCLLYVSDVSYLHTHTYIYIYIFNQHFILGHLYIIGIGVKENMCVDYVGVVYLYIWGLCGYEVQATIYVSVVCWCNIVFVMYGRLLKICVYIYLYVQYVGVQFETSVMYYVEM